MSVKVLQHKGNRWQVIVSVRLADGSRYREKRRLHMPSISAARNWGQERERYLLQHGPSKAKKEVPTLRQFAPRFLDGHVRANQQKPSGIATQERIIRVHLVPALGELRLEAISTEKVQLLKTVLGSKAPKTINNILTVLGVLLRKAVEWDVIDRMPCVIKQLRVVKPPMAFYTFEEYGRLVDASRATDSRAYLITLLGGEAGLRSGEMVALEWGDVDFEMRQVCIQRSAWKGQIAAPKGGRLRHVPLTKRLEKALRDHCHLRGQRVLVSDDGGPLTERLVQNLIGRAARKANLQNNGPHILRHTFCSHLVMRGASVRAIQELAGHQDLSTTLRYMHLSSGAKESAIRLLDGNIVATASTTTANTST